MCGLMNVGLKKGFAYAFSLCVLAMVWLCFISPLEAVSGGKDWFGRVIVWETRSAEYGGSNEGPDGKSSGECSDKLEAIAVLQYCSGWFYLEDLKYLDVHKCSAQGTHRMKHCKYPTPMESWDCKDLFITRNNKEEGRKFGDTLNVGSDGTYRLKVDGNIKGTHYIFSNSTGNKNCAGERYNLIICTVPYEGAKVHEVLSSRRESEAWAPVLAAAFRPNEPGTTIKPPLVGQVWSISFLADGWVKGNVIQPPKNIELRPSQGGTGECHICGSAVKKIDKNEFKPPKKMANWFLTTDPCEYVKKELEDAVKIKEAYKQMRDDPKTANMGGTAFNDYVIGKLTSDGLAPSAPMETHPDSCGPKDDRAETKEKRYRCLPEIVFEADKAHEEVHQKTCKDLKDDKGEGAYWEYLQDKNNYAKDEINAYNEKIKVLQNWLDKNCKN